VHVKFNVPNDNTNGAVDSLLANDIFVHYFAESELEVYKNHDATDASVQIESAAPFDGLSCKAFKLDKLKMGKQAQRIAAFEAERNKPS
jgi:hypothetical protein